MEIWYYTVVSIDGDYANLKRTDIGKRFYQRFPNDDEGYIQEIATAKSWFE